MKNTYRITGMSCAGCQANVERALSNLKEITNVEIDLKKSQAVIEMTAHVPLEKLQETLLKGSSHYTIEMPSSVIGGYRDQPLSAS